MKALSIRQPHAKAILRGQYRARIDHDEGEPDVGDGDELGDEAFAPSWTVYVNIKMIPEYAEVMRARPNSAESSPCLGVRWKDGEHCWSEW